MSIEPRFRVPCGLRDYIWMFKRLDILADIRARLPYAEIGARRGVSEQRVGEVAREEGLDRRARKLTQGVEAQVAACIRAGDADYPEIGEAFGVAPRTVEAVAHRNSLRFPRANRKPRQLAELSVLAKPRQLAGLTTGARP